MATIPKKKKAQWRDLEAKRITLDLIELGHIRPSEKVAGAILSIACIRAEERTRKTERQKPAYVGVEFKFPRTIDMAIYIVTELLRDWEHCKELKSLWQQAKGEEAKNLLVPTIDRIEEGTEENRGHYERGNIQILSNEANRAKSAQKKMKPRALFCDSDFGTELVVGESVTAMASILGVKSHATAKRYSYSYKRLESTTEEERKVQCEVHGITYETAEERAKRRKRMLEKAFNK